MREWIDIVKGNTDLPTVVYHGTSDSLWAKGTVGTLYLTASREDALNYADEAVVSDFYNRYGDDADHDELPMPSQGIIVTFRFTDLAHLEDRFEPDWGWVESHDAPDNPTWRESLKTVGSFCIADVGPNEKALGEIETAFPQ